jgi:hypothetical protein
MGFSSIQKTASTGSSATGALVGVNSLQPEINSHQCTSWPFCPLDGLRFFIRRQMGFITIDFFLLLTTVLFFFFFFFFCFWSFFLDLTSHVATCSLSYPHKYCTNLGILFIIPY